MTRAETFVVVDWLVNSQKIEDHVVFIGNEVEAREFSDAQDVEAGYKGRVEVMSFADFCYDVRREAECNVN